MHAIKKLKNYSIIIALVIILALSVVMGVFGMSKTTARAEDDFQDYAPASLGLSNPNFDSSSGSYPATPSSWTGSSLDGGSGNVLSGVVDLTDSTYFGSDSGNKKFKLDRYPEYANAQDKPRTIFGANTEYGGDAKTLMINTVDGAEVAYAYKSADMSFVPNSYYRVSAWVKTGNFASDTGATIKLTGLGQNCSFININTVKNIPTENGIPQLSESNKYGWVKYSFYVRTSSSYTRTVNLVLGIGDAVNNDEEDPDEMTRPADGYAFFDTVSAERISAHDFALLTERFEPTDKDNVYKLGNQLLLDLYDATPFISDDVSTFSTNTTGVWKNAYYDENSTDLSYVGVAHSFLFNSEIPINDFDNKRHNPNGFTANPVSPNGGADNLDVNSRFFPAQNNNIMVISTYDGTEFKQSALGIASPTVGIDRYKFYRFGVWVKTDSSTGGDGVTILIKGKRDGATKVRTLNDPYTGLGGDSTDTAHFGWKEQTVYIQGSMLYDYTVSFELWFGSPDSLSSGIAMFDNITFTELSYTDYKDMSAADGGNILTLDTETNDTNVANGNFGTVGDFDTDEITFPLPVAEWTFYTPETVETNGYSKDDVDTSRAVHGLLPVDDETFNRLSTDQVIPGVRNPAPMDNSLQRVLLLSSVKPTAYCYQSPTITLTTDKANMLTVELAVDGVKVGNGASLILKTTNGDVISSIQNIKTTNGEFKPFTFYLAAPLSDQTVYLEIWLGNNKRTTSELSDGNIYVRRVALTEWTAGENSTVAREYEQKLAEYQEAIKNPNTIKTLDYGCYSFASPSLDYYDVYSYGGENGESFGAPYQWSRTTATSNPVISGMFNADDRKNIVLYDGFDAKDMQGNMLYIYNVEKNRTTYTYDNTISLVSNTYYRLDVSVKVKVSDEVRTDKTSVGANIKLTGSTAEFTNIKDTTTLVSKYNEESRDYETFKTYTFYISTGADGGDIGLQISFGGDDRTSYIQGRLIVAGIKMTAIDELDFEDADKVADNKTSMTVRLSDTTTNNDASNSEAVDAEIQWWIIPTIIFSAALIAVIVIIIVVRVRDKIKRNKKVTYSSEYDRNDVMRDIERLQEQDAADKKAATKKDATPLPDLDARSETYVDDDEQELNDDPTENVEEQEPAESDAQPEEETSVKEETQQEKPQAPSNTDELDD